MNKTDLYLYKRDNYSSSYRVGNIKRINDKTITMSDGSKLNKDTFNEDVYKLSESEKAMYEKEIIKKFNRSRNEIDTFVRQLIKLNQVLRESHFVGVNTISLQAQLDEVAKVLAKDFENYLELQNRAFTIDCWNNVVEVKEEN